MCTHNVAGIGVGQVGRESMCTQIDSIIRTGGVSVAQPEYLRIAADLRRRIAEGEGEPGGQLPPLAHVGAASGGLSQPPTRTALRPLPNGGLIEPGARAGTLVRPRP